MSVLKDSSIVNRRFILGTCTFTALAALGVCSSLITPEARAAVSSEVVTSWINEESLRAKTGKPAPSSLKIAENSKEIKSEPVKETKESAINNDATQLKTEDKAPIENIDAKIEETPSEPSIDIVATGIAPLQPDEEIFNLAVASEAPVISSPSEELAKTVSSTSEILPFGEQQINAEETEAKEKTEININKEARPVYTPKEKTANIETSNVSAKPQVAAWKEANLNISQEEELYLRDTKRFVAGDAPKGKIMVSPFTSGNYIADGVQVSPMSTYLAANKNNRAVGGNLIARNEINDTTTNTSMGEGNNGSENTNISDKTAQAQFITAPVLTPMTNNTQMEVSALQDLESEAWANREESADWSEPKANAVLAPIGQNVQSDTPSASSLEALLSGSDIPAKSSSNLTAPLAAIGGSAAQTIPEFGTQPAFAPVIPSFADSFAPAGNNTGYAPAQQALQPQADIVPNKPVLVPITTSQFAANTPTTGNADNNAYGGAISNYTSGSKSSGYGTNYGTYTAGGAMPSAPNPSSLAYDNAGGAGQAPIATPATQQATTGDAGLFNKLKNWFLSDNTSVTAPRQNVPMPMQPTANVTAPKQSAANSLDDVISRYTNKEMQRNAAKAVAEGRFTSQATITFAEGSTNFSLTALKWLNSFAAEAAKRPNAVVKMKVSQTNLPLQMKRLALVKTVLINNNVAVDKIKAVTGKVNPDTITLTIEGAGVISNGYRSNIDAMEGL